jgi:hypothetical protein
MTSTSPLGTLGSVAYLLAVTVYQEMTSTSPLGTLGSVTYLLVVTVYQEMTSTSGEVEVIS